MDILNVFGFNEKNVNKTTSWEDVIKLKTNDENLQIFITDIIGNGSCL